MARVKRGVTAHARHKKILKMAKGYFGRKSKLFKVANQQVLKSGNYAYRDRRRKKRDMRKLWITRINAACRLNDLSYSRFINGLHQAGISLDRKVLAEIAYHEPEHFAKLVAEAKKHLA